MLITNFDVGFHLRLKDLLMYAQLVCNKLLNTVRFFTCNPLENEET